MVELDTIPTFNARSVLSANSVKSLLCPFQSIVTSSSESSSNLFLYEELPRQASDNDYAIQIQRKSNE